MRFGGIGGVLAEHNARAPDHNHEPEPHAARRVATGLVVPSHGSSQRTDWRLRADGLPWPICRSTGSRTSRLH